MKPDPRLCLALFQSRFSALLSRLQLLLGGRHRHRASYLPSASDARPSVRRPLFLLSLVVSPVLWERGGVGAHGRALRGGDAGERALLPIGLVATAAVVATACATRCGQCAPIFGFLVQTCRLVYASSDHSRLNGVKNKGYAHGPLCVALFSERSVFQTIFQSESMGCLALRI